MYFQVRLNEQVDKVTMTYYICLNHVYKLKIPCNDHLNSYYNYRFDQNIAWVSILEFVY